LRGVLTFDRSEEVLDLGGSPVRRELVNEHVVRGAFLAACAQVIAKSGPRAPS
jgi:hypothetical protein